MGAKPYKPTIVLNGAADTVVGETLISDIGLQDGLVLGQDVLEKEY